MIPDFKTYLKESIWSDMQDRGTGDIIKTEDISSINNMKKDQFFDFLCDRYTQVSGEKWFIRDYHHPAISFPVFSTKDDNEEFSVFITGFRDRTKSVYVKDNFILNASDMLEKLQDSFTVDIIYRDTEPDWAEIYPKDQSEITNYFFVTVVDFLIDNVDTNKYKRMQKRSGSLKESIWSDMQERGTGDIVKREDDIDLLDRYGFFAYLNKIYRTTPPSKIWNYDELNSILVPLFGVNKAPLPPKHLSVEIDYNDGQEITIGKMLMGNFPAIENDLRDSFNVEDMPAGEIRGEYLKIHPKDGSPVTNSFFITVIDFLLEKAGDKYTIILSKK